MKFIIALTVLLSFQAFASKLNLVDVNIISIEEGDDKHSLAYGSDGRVYRIKNSDTEALGQVKALLNSNTNELSPIEFNQTESDFYPTNLRSVQEAQMLFKTMYKNSRRKSQCYMRAHGWAYDLYRNYNVNSEKIFIFFTRQYILKYRYKWWFHVSPMVTVNGEKMVMDRKFTDGPLPIKEWTDIFMKNNVECPVVKTYEDYENNFDSRDCLLRLTPMYFWSPISIKLHDNGKDPRYDWQMGEVRASMRKAFNGFPNSL